MPYLVFLLVSPVCLVTCLLASTAISCVSKFDYVGVSILCVTTPTRTHRLLMGVVMTIIGNIHRPVKTYEMTDSTHSR